MSNQPMKNNYIIENLQNELFLWGSMNFRDFPWRHTKDPYKIMIAEFMLHRTRAVQVVSVYTEFINKYPDIISLSQADISDVSDFTAHLGLHWRSGHFIEAAKFVVNKFDGKIPDNSDELLLIPGVGEYVCGAIMTVCFGKPYPVVDSNIARFINRFFGLNLSGEIRRKKEIRNIAGKLFEVENPGNLLFAILDFTTEICRPGKPIHLSCPFRRNCEYYTALFPY